MKLVLKIRIFTDCTLNSVRIYKSFQKLNFLNYLFVIDCFLLRQFFTHSNFLQKLLVFLLQNYSVFMKKILIWSQNQSFANVVLQCFKTQKLRNFRIKLAVNPLDFFKISFSMNRHMFQDIFNDFFNFNDLNPSIKGLTKKSNIESHEFMIWRVINSRLYPSFIIRMVWPCTSKIFAIDLDTFDIFIFFKDFIFDLMKVVVKSINQGRGIKEVLFEIWSDILDWNRNFLGNEISSSCIFDEVRLEIINDGEISSMYFLGSNPKNVFLMKVGIENIFNKLSIG